MVRPQLLRADPHRTGLPCALGLPVRQLAGWSHPIVVCHASAQAQLLWLTSCSADDELDEATMFGKIAAGDIDTADPVWLSISDAAKDLVVRGWSLRHPLPWAVRVDLRVDDGHVGLLGLAASWDCRGVRQGVRIKGAHAPRVCRAAC